MLRRVRARIVLGTAGLQMLVSSWLDWPRLLRRLRLQRTLDVREGSVPVRRMQVLHHGKVLRTMHVSTVLLRQKAKKEKKNNSNARSIVRIYLELTTTWNDIAYDMNVFLK
jgi:hypothetical protein